MSDGKKHDALNRFKDVTGADDDRAKFYMESSNWDLDVSVPIVRLMTFVTLKVKAFFYSQSALTNYLDDNEHELRHDSDIEELPTAETPTQPSASLLATHRSTSDSQKPVKKPASKPSGK